MSDINNIKGMSRHRGVTVDKDMHIVQSLTDILTTPIGTRVMRRNYGSLIPFLIDQPLNQFLVMQIRSATTHAIMRWEKRITPIHIELNTLNTKEGRASLTIDYQYVASKRVARTFLAIGGVI